MRSTRQLSITLPNEMADWVKAKTASGAYASESEVIRDGLRALRERDEAVERWLRDEVLPSLLALEADPSRPSRSTRCSARWRIAARRGGHMSGDAQGRLQA